MMFEPTIINGKRVKNRIIRSATNDHLGTPEGTVTDAEVDMYDALASNEVGIIITGHLSVSPDLNLRADEMQLSIGSDTYIKGLTRIAEQIHKYESIVLAQISLAGPAGLNPFDINSLSTAQMRVIREWFISAAIRAKASGFDGVQLHCAHFYFLQALLCADINKRTDEYGGCSVNRIRLVREIAEGIRTICGEDFIVTAKLNCHNTLEAEDDYDMLLLYCRMLAEAGVVLFEISGRDFAKQQKDASLYYLDAVKYLKDKAPDINVALVGGIYSKDTINKALEFADYASISRALITQPDMIRQIKEDLLQKSRCIHCNQCFRIFSTKYKRCVFGPVIPQLQHNFG